jgi:hypothetical protein
MDLSIIKRKVTHDDLDKFAFFATEEEKIKCNVHLNCNIVAIPDKKLRSYEQLKLYWTSCQVVSENHNDNNFDTKEKVDEQTKIHCRLVECYYYYQNEKTGESTLNIKTGSISYAELPHLEACNYFDQAFKFHADLLKITVDELMQEIHTRGVKKYSNLGDLLKTTVDELMDEVIQDIHTRKDGIKFEDVTLFGGD